MKPTGNGGNGGSRRSEPRREFTETVCREVIPLRPTAIPPPQRGVSEGWRSVPRGLSGSGARSARLMARHESVPEGGGARLAHDR